MTKKIALAVVAIYAAWFALNFVIHGLILGSTYASEPQFWRPMDEMKRGLMFFVSLISATGFVLIYSRLIANKSLNTGLHYGLLYGVANGISVGYGTYSVMAVPYYMALTWFLGTLVEMTVAGILVGLIVKE